VTPNIDFKVTILFDVKNSKMVHDSIDRALVMMADQYEVVLDLSIGAMFNDLERPITQISRSR